MIRGQGISMERGPLAFAGMPIDLPVRMKQVQLTERRKVARRLGHLEQGQALEMLGHAVEHLVDSRFFGMDAQVVKNNQDAVQILMRLSRVVFCQYPEVVPPGRKVGRWLRDAMATVTGR